MQREAGKGNPRLTTKLLNSTLSRGVLAEVFLRRGSCPHGALARGATCEKTGRGPPNDLTAEVFGAIAQAKETATIRTSL
jgi:hypothetical protein